GKPPFLGATYLDTLSQVVGEDPRPPRRLNDRIPRELELVCLKCLEKEPHRRYASAAALGEDLRRFGAGETVRGRGRGLLRRGASWLRRRRTAATALLGLLGVAVALILGGRAPQRASPEEPRASEQWAAFIAVGKYNEPFESLQYSVPDARL